MASQDNKDKKDDESVLSPTFSEFTKGVTLARQDSNSQQSQSQSNQSDATPQTRTPEDSPNQLLSHPPAAQAFQRTPSPPDAENSDNDSKTAVDTTATTETQAQPQGHGTVTPSNIDISQTATLATHGTGTPSQPHATRTSMRTPQLQSHTPHRSLLDQIDIANDLNLNNKNGNALTTVAEESGTPAEDDTVGDLPNLPNINPSIANNESKEKHSTQMTLDAAMMKSVIASAAAAAARGDEDHTDGSQDEEEDILDDETFASHLSAITSTTQGGSGGGKGGRRATLNISALPTHKQMKERKKQRESTRVQQPPLSQQKRLMTRPRFETTALSVGSPHGGTRAPLFDTSVASESNENETKTADVDGSNTAVQTQHARKRSSLSRRSLRRKHSRTDSLAEKGSLRELSTHHRRDSSNNNNNNLFDETGGDYGDYNDGGYSDEDRLFDDNISDHSDSGDMGSGVVFVRRKTASFSSQFNDDLHFVHRPSTSIDFENNSAFSMDTNDIGTSIVPVDRDHHHHQRQSSSIGGTDLFADVFVRDFYTTIPDTYDEREKIALKEKEKETQGPIKRRHSLSMLSVQSSVSLVPKTKEQKQEQEQKHDQSKEEPTAQAQEQTEKPQTTPETAVKTEDIQKVPPTKEVPVIESTVKVPKTAPAGAVTTEPSELTTEPTTVTAVPRVSDTEPTARVAGAREERRVVTNENEDQNVGFQSIAPIIATQAAAPVTERQQQGRRDSRAGNESREDRDTSDPRVTGDSRDIANAREEETDTMAETEEARIRAASAQVKKRESTGFLTISFGDVSSGSQGRNDYSHQWDLPSEYQSDNLDFATVNVPDLQNNSPSTDQLASIAENKNDNNEIDAGNARRRVSESPPKQHTQIRSRQSQSSESGSERIGGGRRPSITYSDSPDKEEEDHSQERRPGALDVVDSDSDRELRDGDSKQAEDAERVVYDKMQNELDWKSSYFGMLLIGGMWCSSFHCLYSMATVEYEAYQTYGLTTLDFGLLYGSTFLGLAFGILWSSYLLNKPEWFSKSQDIGTLSIFFVFLTQIIISCIFIHTYYVSGAMAGVAWFFLIVSRFILGFGIGFVESSANNLVYEWFSQMDSAGDIGKAIGVQGRLSDNSDTPNNNNNANNDGRRASESSTSSALMPKLFSQTAVYATEDANGAISYDASDEAAEKTLFLKEFGHISARILCVPLIWLTFSDNNNLFLAMFFGVILTGASTISMTYAWNRDRKIRNNYQKIIDTDNDDTALLTQDNSNTNNINTEPYQTFDNRSRQSDELSHSSRGSPIRHHSVPVRGGTYGTVENVEHNEPNFAIGSDGAASVPPKGTQGMQRIQVPGMMRHEKTKSPRGASTPRMMVGFGIGGSTRTYSDVASNRGESSRGSRGSRGSRDSLGSHDLELGGGGAGSGDSGDVRETQPLSPAMEDVEKDRFLEDMTYKDWFEMDCVGLNASTVLSILFLSVNFGISFAFVILSLNCFVEQYNYVSYTANLLIAVIPLSSILFSNALRVLLSKITTSIFLLMILGNTCFAFCYGLLAFSGVNGGPGAWLLPVFVVIIYVFGIECVTSTGYEILLTTAPEYIHGLVSGVNSTCNFATTALFCLIFGALVLDDADNVSLKFQGAFVFLFVVSLLNYGVIAAMRYSTQRLLLNPNPILSPAMSQ